jgi:hypothetical protein
METHSMIMMMETSTFTIIMETLNTSLLSMEMIIYMMA